MSRRRSARPAFETILAAASRRWARFRSRSRARLPGLLSFALHDVRSRGIQRAAPPRSSARFRGASNWTAIHGAHRDRRDGDRRRHGRGSTSRSSWPAAGVPFQVIEKKRSRRRPPGLENHYPGCGRRHSQPPLLVSPSRKRADWRKYYAARDQLAAYFADLADEFELLDRIAFGTRVVRAAWSDPEARWGGSRSGTRDGGERDGAAAGAESAPSATSTRRRFPASPAWRASPGRPCTRPAGTTPSTWPARRGRGDSARARARCSSSQRWPGRRHA